jgi:hypothetical protein
MTLNVKQEYDRLREAFRKKDQRKQNFLIATIADASPHSQYGFVVATLSDNTPVNVQCWTSDALTNGQNIWIAPISGSMTNWYLLIGVNNSTNLETTPFTAPAPAGLAVHDLNGAYHTGTLPWSKIDTSTTKVDLTSQTTGLLPVANQAKQANFQVITITTGVIADTASETGSVTGPNIGYVRNLYITSSGTATLIIYEDASSTEQYGTSAVSVPFVDDGGWMFVDTTNSNLIRYNITNTSGVSASFTITLKIITW